MHQVTSIPFLYILVMCLPSLGGRSRIAKRKSEVQFAFLSVMWEWDAISVWDSINSFLFFPNQIIFQSSDIFLFTIVLLHGEQSGNYYAFHSASSLHQPENHLLIRIN